MQGNAVERSPKWLEGVAGQREAFEQICKSVVESPGVEKAHGHFSRGGGVGEDCEVRSSGV